MRHEIDTRTDRLSMHRYAISGQSLATSSLLRNGCKSLNFKMDDTIVSSFLFIDCSFLKKKEQSMKKKDGKKVAEVYAVLFIYKKKRAQTFASVSLSF